MYSKYVLVILLKDIKGITFTNAFQKILNESNRKRNKTWLDKGSEFYNRSKKLWLEKKCIQHIMNENLLLLKGSLGP